MQRRPWALATAGMLLPTVWCVAQDAERAPFDPFIGKVTVATVNVRSGPSTNYYVVTRLKTDALIKVVGEEHGWLEIIPPPGCFSLISADYVDRDGDGDGVVNADNVRVRAGSLLSDDLYRVQLKLSRGASVRVIDQGQEGYLKIEPPEGATLWVSREYIERVPNALPDAALTAAGVVAPAAGPAPAGSSPVDAHRPDVVADRPSATEPAGPAAGIVATAPKAAGAASPAQEPKAEIIAADAGEHRRQLEVLDAELEEEMSKPLERRNFATLLPRYRQLAEQEADDYTQAYARVRVRQIESAQDMVEGLRTVQQLREGVRDVRKTALAGRTAVRSQPVRIDGGFDAEGELRPSALYDSPVGPQRYRLVDPAVVPPRTLGYVEIPPELRIDVSDFLGRRVGVRARERILQTGDVDPISVYVAAELVVLDRRAVGQGEGLETLAGQPASEEDVAADDETATASSNP